MSGAELAPFDTVDLAPFGAVHLAPFGAGELARFRAAREQGADAAAAFDALARELPDERRARFGRLAKESRAAWCALFADASGSVLLVGNALSGAAVALASRARQLVLCDPSPQRLELARAWVAVAVPDARVDALAGGADARLPFADGAFDLVVQELEPAGEPRLRELARVSRGAVAALVEPRTTAASRRAVRAHGFGATRIFGLHPDARDPGSLSALDGRAPRYFAGASRTRALLAGLARAAGQAPRLARSHALHAARSPRRAPLEEALAELAHRLGEPLPEPEHVLGSCGDTCEVFTRRPNGPARDPRGRWRLHLPMRPDHAPGLERNHRVLERLRAAQRALPAPDPLFVGEAAGLWLTCERRSPGFSADLLPRRRALGDRIALQAAEHLAQLVVRAPEPFAAADFEREVEPWFERALGITTDARARAALDDLRRRAREELSGLALPRVLVHGDLRAKHVQARRDGRVVAYVHWGVALDSGLPLFDLFHLLAHSRLHFAGERLASAWRALLDGDLRPEEGRALDRHADLLDLPRESRAALALAYPAFVATVGFQFSALAPPNWLARQFELG